MAREDLGARRRRFYQRPITKGELELTGPEGRHLVQALRGRCGQWVELFDGAGTVAQAEVLRIERSGRSWRCGRWSVWRLVSGGGW